MQILYHCEMFLKSFWTFQQSLSQWIKHEGSGLLYHGSPNNLIIKLVSLQCYLCLALQNNKAYNNHF